MVIDKFLGLNNTVSSERMSPGDLEEAINVYLDDTGRLARRSGVTQVSAVATHSLWSSGNICLFVQGTDLKRMYIDGSITTLRSDMSGNRVSYQMLLGTVYYSDGVVTGEYSDGFNRTKWGVSSPGLVGASITSGALPAGRYGYVGVAVRDDGIRSGAIDFGTIELSSDGGITFTAPNIDEAAVAFYMTSTDGDVFYASGSCIPGSSVNITNVNVLGEPLESINLMEPPAGQIVSFFRGRMLVAAGEWLYYSMPYGIHLFDPLGYHGMGDRITIVAPMKNGVFVATTKKTYFLLGTSPEEFTLQEIADYGAIEGTLSTIASTDLPWLRNVASQTLAVWASSAGICLAGDEGLFINMTENRYRFDVVLAKGATTIITMDRTKQLITAIE